MILPLQQSYPAFKQHPEEHTLDVISCLYQTKVATEEAGLSAAESLPMLAHVCKHCLRQTTAAQATVLGVEWLLPYCDVSLPQSSRQQSAVTMPFDIFLKKHR